MQVEIQELKNLMKELVLSQKETDAMFKETSAKFKETDAMFKETSAKFKETDEKFKETNAKFKETDIRFKETDAQIKQTDKKVKEAFELFTSQWGKLVESLVEGDLVNILRAKGIEVHDTSMRRKGSHEGQNFEFDIIAHNGTEIVIVEVKTTLKTQDVKQFIAKLKNAKLWLQEYKNYNIYGAVAYLRADSGSEIFAQNEKLFAIRATGDSASIINADGFVPRKF